MAKKAKVEKHIQPRPSGRLFGGRKGHLRSISRPLPPKGEIATYICSSVQNNTKVEVGVWANLLAMAEHHGAEVLVSRYTYNKASWGRKSVKPGTGPTLDDYRDLWYDPEVEPFVCDERVQLAPDLVFCGEQNILPTAERPLRGFDSYTGTASGIFPHAKFAMQSIPVGGRDEPTKFNYTTGTVSLRNYIQKKAGLKAEFHHGYGGLIVQVDSSGDWWVRQLNADSDGNIYDLDLKAHGGRVTSGHRVEAITWGDIHVARCLERIVQQYWGDRGVVDILRPKYQFMHDVLDFRARNVHTIGKKLAFDALSAYYEGHDSVEAEVAQAGAFLRKSCRPFCETIVVDSNHDHFMKRWLEMADWKKDPINADYYLDAAKHMVATLKKTPRSAPNLFEWGVKRSLREAVSHLSLNFWDGDKPFIICPGAGGGIDCGQHGHLGPNGAPGSPASLARMGRKMNRGHEHSSGIHDGVYTSGLTGDQDQGYNHGPSSWSRSHILTYENGKRAIITERGDRLWPQ